MVFPRSLSDSKSPNVSRTLLSNLAVLNKVVVWMVSTRPLTSKSSSPYINPLITVPKAPIRIGLIVTLMFHRFLFPSKVMVLILLFPFFQFYSVVSRNNKIHNLANSLFSLTTKRSGILAGIRWSVCMSKSHWSMCECVSFSRTGIGLCTYHLIVWSNFNLLHISQWITLPTQSCLVLYSFCANLLHSLIIWLIVSPLSPNNLDLLFCCVLSILALIWLVLTALFCVAIRIDSVSLLKLQFFSHARFSRVKCLLIV